jgi:hypothetical protein
MVDLKPENTNLKQTVAKLHLCNDWQGNRHIGILALGGGIPRVLPRPRLLSNGADHATSVTGSIISEVERLKRQTHGIERKAQLCKTDEIQWLPSIARNTGEGYLVRPPNANLSKLFIYRLYISKLGILRPVTPVLSVSLVKINK